MAEAGRSNIIIFFDVDNTLLDNDAMQAELDRHLVERFGDQGRRRYREHFEALRREHGFVDFLGALQRFRLEMLEEPAVLELSGWLLGYPFHERLYPHAVEAVRHAAGLGTVVILSDGDGVYQPHKISVAGLGELFDGRVLIFVHKEQQLSTLEERYPADHYVAVDDKLAVLAAMKELWGTRLTTVFVRQGHYGRDPEIEATAPAADLTLESIGQLRSLTLEQLLGSDEGS
jgi:phosphoglycolate phosphatase-like HAD superfamily hydrolase